MKAIGYARVSTTKQDLARQRDKITNFCNDRGYELLTIIEDFGISGASLEREGYQELNKLTDRDCDIIIVSEISRLSRKDQITEALNDIQRILNNGISVLLLDNPNNIYKANETLNLQELIMLVFQLYGAAQERHEIKRKNQDGKQALLRNNPYAVVDAKIPYGFRAVPNKISNKPKYLLEEDPEQVAIIRKIFELVLEGKTLYYVSQYLYDREIKINNGYPFVSLISRLLHNELYIGIRKRTSKFGREEGKEDVVIQHIAPIISEEDFYRAHEMIAQNHKYVQNRGIVYFNPLKGIMRCRCGRAMMVKNRTPNDPNYNKLTFKCSCIESSNSATFCEVKRDEVSYHLTCSIIKSVFIQRHQEIKDYFKQMGEGKIDELKEIYYALERKCDLNRKHKEEIQRKSNLNQEKLLATENPKFIKTLEDNQDKLDAEEVKNESDFQTLEKEKHHILNQIESIKAAYNRSIDERIYNISDDELTELYHLFLDKINYYPITLMKGFYRIFFKSGMELVVALTKVRCSPMAYLIDAKVDFENGDIQFNFTTLQKNDSSTIFPIIEEKESSINIRDFFQSNYRELAFAIPLELDLSYRQNAPKVDKTKRKKHTKQA